MAGSDAQRDELQRGTSALVIARNIRNDIEAGVLKHGQQLPTTRTLADEWGTSVATISRAMNILAEEGVIVNRARSSRLVHYPEPPDEHTEKPRVILIGGYAGSGKSELGRILARNTGWPIIDKDTTTRHVVEAALERLGESPHSRESETYVKAIRPAEYEALLATVTENVQCGISAVVTAPFISQFNDQAWCNRTAATIASLGAELHVIWVRCDVPSMLTYLKHRGAARDAWKLENWDTYLSGLDLDFSPLLPHQVVDNSADSPPLQQQAQGLLQPIFR
ncbi:GntR family transcriptional regulator [Amycolatopsis cihanbeyliensis]|uniref:AAA domain-containing protein n=1 Tax=Amycolatopsis cihanbeyliensis TaxID=1128664 RepID=A0A542DR36_AMYCI|nr:GntR family transcriptional regulator [Amycolatopsis cihanbeyliensis]TQJ05454.1 AAA domain-containing protein [Amycolatopsis cihanbeyliensis]